MTTTPAGVGGPDVLLMLMRHLRQSRERVLSRLDGLSEYDVRRPLVPSGTNLLGLVKHLASVEFGYLGECVGRPRTPQLPWDADGSVWEDGDLWARADESREWVVGLYREAWAWSDASVAELGLTAPAHVPWWPAERADTTLGVLLVRMVAETAQHAGHADVLRELLDGRAGEEGDDRDASWWSEYHARVQAAADAHR